ncbi:hypothetical protein HD554DRAFT_2168276 [Boletus coccyginus]|nr:hypothetical protein HD554DRAFT_2168276 [Boletus coccyginus]
MPSHFLHPDHNLFDIMPPRQRAASLTVGGNSAESRAGQELEASQAQADTGKKKQAGACSRCQAHKVKCEIPPGAKVCNRCQQSGLSDICELKGTATNTSILPSEPQITQGKHRSCDTPTSWSSIPPTSQPKVSTKNKHILENMGRSQKSIVPPSQKRYMIQLALDNATQTAYLDSITEFDEVYGPMTFDKDDEDDVDIPAFPTEALRSADQLLSVVTTGTSEVDYMDVDDGQSEMSNENFNLEDIQDTSNDKDSDVALNDLLQQRRPSKPVVVAAPQACRKQKKQTSKKVTTSDDDSVFTIQCSAPHLDSTHAPFKSLSTVMLTALCDIVAEKMERYPKAVHLQYRLDSDKAKQASTSIQMDNELDIFIGRLQDLIVPERLPSGCKSTRAPKNSVVQFEDAASLGNGGSSHPSKGSMKGSGTASGTTKQKTTPASSADLELDGASRRLKLMEGLATIDEKPASLILDSASRAWSSLNQQGDMPMGQPGFPVGYGYPSYSPPIFVLPQWGVGPQGTGLPGQPSAPGQSGLSAPTPQNMHSVSPTLLKPVPGLIKWFSYLDTHGGRNKNGVIYSQFGPVLRAKGFSHLNHLSHKYIQLSDLEDWVGIEVGTAIDIFEYAEEDLEAARAGTLVLPSFEALDE